MKKIFFTLLFLSLSACSHSSVTNEKSRPETDHFAKMDGCFLLYNVKTEKFDKVINESRCQARFSACSTFKVPLALMAFDSGALANEKTILKWDHEKRALSSWNHDHDARGWMKESVVWFSQRLTAKMGMEEVERYLRNFEYGNQDMSAGITEAWLVQPSAEKGALKISAYEQVEFMKNFWAEKLEVSPRATNLTKEITYLETSPTGFRLHGKTGSNTLPEDNKLRFGWFIGHLEKENQEYIVVANFSDLLPPKDSSYGGLAAKDITRKILRDEKLW